MGREEHTVFGELLLDLPQKEELIIWLLIVCKNPCPKLPRITVRVNFVKTVQLILHLTKVILLLEKQSGLQVAESPIYREDILTVQECGKSRVPLGLFMDFKPKSVFERECAGTSFSTLSNNEITRAIAGCQWLPSTWNEQPVPGGQILFD